jgi:hypothetical protein
MTVESITKGFLRAQKARDLPENATLKARRVSTAGLIEGGTSTTS